ncbi:MAG: hypothetical protein JWN14_3152 [Chthonomonadales bacterium]|nr:hypothetical protein [Chthonomonadales bacterium]
MLLNAPEELPLAALLRKTITRLRELTPHAGGETSAAESGEEEKCARPSGVPLVLPFDTERRVIPRLLRKLRRGHFLRYRPDTLEEYAPLTPYAADYFLERLRTAHVSRWRECIVATWALGRLTPEDPARGEVEKVLYWLVSPEGGSITIADNRRMLNLWLKSVFTMACVVANLWIQADRNALPFDPFLSGIAIISALIFSLPLTVFLLFNDIPWNMRRLNRIRARALLTLGRWREPRHLSLLLREYVGKMGRVRLAAEVALREVLPLLKTEDKGEHSADFVSNLCRALRRKERQFFDYTPREEALEILILEALGKVGDGHAIPTVQRIAVRGRTSRLQELAQSILPILQARSRQATDPNQLLRGADRPENPSTTLLRPAYESSTPSEQLLRPHNAD